MGQLSTMRAVRSEALVCLESMCSQKLSETHFHRLLEHLPEMVNNVKQALAQASMLVLIRPTVRAVVCSTYVLILVLVGLALLIFICRVYFNHLSFVVCFTYVDVCPHYHYILRSFVVLVLV